MNLNVFWDNSNIWLVGRNVCHNKEPGDESAFRIHFANLLDFVVGGRTTEFAFVGGSIPPQSDPLWNRFEMLGAKVRKQERGAESGGEVAVDEAIQLQMANRVLAAPMPGTMVLLTGDGAGHLDGEGFINQLELAHRHGWAVEGVSWDAGCNRYLKSYARKAGTYKALEPEYDYVTFINNKRWAKHR